MDLTHIHLEMLTKEISEPVVRLDGGMRLLAAQEFAFPSSLEGL